ncbi:MAG: radical SAM family heme chaperone HemW [Firmicutes bacterium]|nr:radical SAM family heme chaperone HemW [Bacillota bacterium]
MKNNIGIYIHIPFCVKKCLYCGFLSAPFTDETELIAYKDMLVSEIEACYVATECGESRSVVDSIFIGGGTPSVMPVECIAQILSVVNNKFYVTKDCEITIETNPGTLDAQKLADYSRMGINRLSIGVQSFDDDVLKILGRIHTAKEAVEAFKMARSAGFININIDLMFGISGQTMEQWNSTLKKAIELNPEHISFYGLQIEEGTPYYERFMAGDFDELPDELDRDMYHTAIGMLRSAGYKHYEISNAAKPGFECRHNLKYWTGQEYIGFGDSAASYIRIDESAGSCNTEERTGAASVYIVGMRYTMMNGEKTCLHVNSKFDDMSEYAFTGLRLTRGINYRAFKERFGIDFREAFADRWNELTELFESGVLIEYVSNEGEPVSLTITEQGFDISNRIMAVFV